MATPFQKSGIKVLKKCKECGIYPNLTTHVYWHSSSHSFSKSYTCPKCLKKVNFSQCPSDKSDSECAKLEWNKANGLDEKNPDTWHDNHCEEHFYLTVPGFSNEPEGFCRRCGKCGFRPIKIEEKLR